jgi:hypothetical protein
MYYKTSIKIITEQNSNNSNSSSDQSDDKTGLKARHLDSTAREVLELLWPSALRTEMCPVLATQSIQFWGFIFRFVLER